MKVTFECRDCEDCSESVICQITTIEATDPPRYCPWVSTGSKANWNEVEEK